MIFIAHRGNTSGVIPLYENSPEYVKAALQAGFYVEVDVWWFEGKFWLGHDKPTYEVERWWLRSAALWCHAKTVETLCKLLDINAHCFFHISDDAVMTSRGYIWTFPGKPLTERSISLDFGGHQTYCIPPAGICSDHIQEVRERVEKGV